jgi:DNA repair protein RecO (recombination protein O)
MTDQVFKAVVLRTRDVGETDCIVHLLTDKHGRVAARAASARRSLKRFGGALDMGAVVQAQASRVPGRDMWRLNLCDPVADRPRLKTNFETLSRAAVLIESVLVLVGPDDPCPDVFELVVQGLERLEAAPDRTAERTVVVVGLARLLALTGFAPRLSNCRNCGRSLEGSARVFYSPGSGGVLCQGCAGEGTDRDGLDRGGLITLQKVIASDLAPAWRLRFSAAALDRVEAFLFGLVQRAAERPLKSLKALNPG